MNAAGGSPLEAVLTSFSPTADVLAISSGDGRIKVSAHLASRYTRQATPLTIHAQCPSCGAMLLCFVLMKKLLVRGFMQMIADADLFAYYGSIFGPHVHRPRLGLLEPSSEPACLLTMQTWDVSSSRVRADLATGTVPTITEGAAGAQGSTSGFHLTALAWGQVAVGKASKVTTGSRNSTCPKFQFGECAVDGGNLVGAFGPRIAAVSACLASLEA
jgi:hypothetical protein